MGEFEGKDFIVMEYVEGKTLAEKLRHARLPVSQALQVALEVAEALQTAHGKGIIHRDLKPSNIMLTKTGHAKVMDFGLAKQIVPAVGMEAQEKSASAMTRTGMTLGTLAYMSPEQLKGETADVRSDIFSFGLVLYEMLTGTHPFRKGSPVETTLAILQEEPKPVGEITKSIPPDLDKLISRCLRKDPERRIQHLDDAKLALEEIKSDLESGRLQLETGPEKRAPSMWFIVGTVAIVALLVFAVISWYWLSWQRNAEPEGLSQAVPLTSYPGWEDIPSFSPNGNSVAFQWCPAGQRSNRHIYVKQVGMDPPRQLTTNPAEDFCPAWSPDGRFIAFMRKLSTADAALLIIPEHGGQEKVLVESGVPLGSDFLDPRVIPYLTWTPDSKWLVFPWRETDKVGQGLFLLSLETLEKRRLTNETDACPAMSPDGRNLTFARWKIRRSEMHLLRLDADFRPEGVPQGLTTTEPFIWAVDWMPNGKEIVFSSGNMSNGSLWRMAASVSAKPRRLATSSEDVGAMALSRQGNHLAYSVPRLRNSIWRVDLHGSNQIPGTPFPLISSTRQEYDPAFSPDGKKIMFCSNRSGHFEIWVCESDGSNQQQLASFGAGDATAPKWSPDGRKICFDASTPGNSSIFIVSASGSAPRRLTNGPTDQYPCWSHDGQWIYYKSRRSGEYEIWKMPAMGGDPVQITHNGADLPQESPDGKFLYYIIEQRFHLAEEFFIARTGLCEERGSSAGLQSQCSFEDFLDPIPFFPGHLMLRSRDSRSSIRSLVELPEQPSLRNDPVALHRRGANAERLGGFLD